MCYLEQTLAEINSTPLSDHSHLEISVLLYNRAELYCHFSISIDRAG